MQHSLYIFVDEFSSADASKLHPSQQFFGWTVSEVEPVSLTENKVSCSRYQLHCFCIFLDQILNLSILAVGAAMVKWINHKPCTQGSRVQSQLPQPAGRDSKMWPCLHIPSAVGGTLNTISLTHSLIILAESHHYRKTQNKWV